MDFVFLARGLIMGFSVAAVVGPIGLLCITRTLRHGFFPGLITGMGAATADGLYGCVAAFGLTVVSTFLLDHQNWIRLIGGMFLIYLGLRTILTPPAEQAANVRASRSFLSMYAATFFLTMTNPLTILSFAAIFAGLGVGAERTTTVSAILVVAGVFLGSAAWWLLLSGGVSLFREKVTSHWLLWINRISGGIILLFGVYAFIVITPSAGPW